MARLLFFFILFVASKNVNGQRLAVDLTYQVAKPVVSYQTSRAIINFTKQDVLDEYEKIKGDYWYTLLSDNEKTRYEAAITWLKNIKNVSLNESMPANKNDSTLVDLIQKIIGATLLTNGKAEVQDINGKRQESIQYETYLGSSKSTPHSFFFSNANQSFFSGSTNKVMVSITESTSEVVFDEPVEVKPEPVENQIFIVVEDPPSYPGGMTKFYDYLKANIKYPKRAKWNGIEGKVFVSFIVKSDGIISDVMIIKGLEKDCDDEALRLVRESGTWIPGKQRGKAVNVKFVVPVTFKLSDKK